MVSIRHTGNKAGSQTAKPDIKNLGFFRKELLLKGEPTGLIAELGVAGLPDGRIEIAFTLSSKTSESFDEADKITAALGAGWYKNMQGGMKLDQSTKVYARSPDECVGLLDEKTQRAVYGTAGRISYRLEDKEFIVKDESDNSKFFSRKRIPHSHGTLVHERTDQANSRFIATTTEPCKPEDVISRLEAAIDEAMADNFHALTNFIRSKPGTEIKSLHH